MDDASIGLDLSRSKHYLLQKKINICSDVWKMPSANIVDCFELKMILFLECVE